MRFFILPLVLSVAAVGLVACSDKKKESKATGNQPAQFISLRNTYQSFCPKVPVACRDCIYGDGPIGNLSIAKGTGYYVPKGKSKNYFTTLIAQQCKSTCTVASGSAFNKCLTVNPEGAFVANDAYLTLQFAESIRRASMTCEKTHQLDKVSDKCRSYIKAHCNIHERPEMKQALTTLTNSWTNKMTGKAAALQALMSKLIGKCAKSACTSGDVKRYVGGAVCVIKATFPEEMK